MLAVPAKFSLIKDILLSGFLPEVENRECRISLSQRTLGRWQHHLCNFPYKKKYRVGHLWYQYAIGIDVYLQCFGSAFV